MNWAHLPEAGGLYAQNPLLIDRFQEIMQAEAREEQRKKHREARNKPKINVKNPGSGA